MYKPDLESISPDSGHSYKYAYFDKSYPNTNKVKWHYHPEIELVYINFGVGKRQVGTHLSNYQSGDLILIGSYLPHTGFTKGFEENQKEIVIQFKPEIFEKAFQNLEFIEVMVIQLVHMFIVDLNQHSFFKKIQVPLKVGNYKIIREMDLMVQTNFYNHIQIKLKVM